MKEIKLSPNISANDVDYRVKQANKFLEKGHQVKVTLSFKGREKLHEDIGVTTLTNFISKCEGTQTGNFKKIEGRRKQITVTLNPRRNKQK